MHPDTVNYNKSFGPQDRAICRLLAREIDQALPEAENKIWHAQPVWFVDGNPVVGYSKLKECVRCAQDCLDYPVGAPFHFSLVTRRLLLDSRDSLGITHFLQLIFDFIADFEVGELCLFIIDHDLSTLFELVNECFALLVPNCHFVRIRAGGFDPSPARRTASS
jgi:hypothetical protein